MKVENIHEVKTRFSRYVRELPKSGSVIITRNGWPCATLVPESGNSACDARVAIASMRAATRSSAWGFEADGPA